MGVVAEALQRQQTWPFSLKIMHFSACFASQDFRFEGNLVNKRNERKKISTDVHKRARVSLMSTTIGAKV
jgi:hypothetical protein